MSLVRRKVSFTVSARAGDSRVAADSSAAIRTLRKIGMAISIKRFSEFIQLSLARHRNRWMKRTPAIDLETDIHLRHKFLIENWAGRLAASLLVGPRTQDSSNSRPWSWRAWKTIRQG